MRSPAFEKIKRSSDVCPLDLRSRHVCSKGPTFGTVKLIFRSLGLVHFLSACVPIVFGLLAFRFNSVGFVLDMFLGFGFLIKLVGKKN